MNDIAKIFGVARRNKQGPIDAVKYGC